MSLIVFILLNISLSFAIDSSLKFAQVGSNLTLDCPCQSYPCDTINWKFNSVVIQNNSTDFIIFNKNITSFLNIKSLTVNASNTEEFTAFVFQSGAAEKPLCRISVHLYDNPTKFNGYIQIENSIKQQLNLTYNQSIIPSIQTRDPYIFPVEFTYQFNARPLDTLKLYNTNLTNLRECKDDSLKCLEALNYTFILENANSTNSCPKNQIKLNLSYAYDNEKEFYDAGLPKPKVFEYLIGIEYAPISDKLTIDKDPDFNTQVKFTCKIKCSNPDNLTYNWSIKLYKENSLVNLTEDVHYTNNFEDTFDYLIDNEFDYIIVNCSITNEIFESVQLSETFEKILPSSSSETITIVTVSTSTTFSSSSMTSTTTHSPSSITCPTCSTCPNISSSDKTNDSNRFSIVIISVCSALGVLIIILIAMIIWCVKRQPKQATLNNTKAKRTNESIKPQKQEQSYASIPRPPPIKKYQREYNRNPSYNNNSFQSDCENYSNRSPANISARIDEDNDLYDNKNDGLADVRKFSSYYSNEMIRTSARRPMKSKLSPLPPLNIHKKKQIKNPFPVIESDIL